MPEGLILSQVVGGVTHHLGYPWGFSPSRLETMFRGLKTAWHSQGPLPGFFLRAHLPGTNRRYQSAWSWFMCYLKPIHVLPCWVSAANVIGLSIAFLDHHVCVVRGEYPTVCRL